MKKLEDIPKKNIYKVPEGYFDQLPATIQARIAKDGSKPALSGVLGFSLKYALPVAALVVVAILWFRPSPSVQMQLDEIDESQIAFYLDNSYGAEVDQATDESDWTEMELRELEDEVYSNMDYSSETEDILDDIDL